MHSFPYKLYESLGQSHLKKIKLCHSSFSLLIFIEYMSQLFTRIYNLRTYDTKCSHSSEDVCVCTLT